MDDDGDEMNLEESVVTDFWIVRQRGIFLFYIFLSE
jgi:hypothetical protein